MMKQRLQMTIVEPTISTPAWRSASPKKRNTRPRKISPKTRAENLTMSPKEATQSFGTASKPGISSPLLRPATWALPPRSLDHRDLWVGREQRLREHVVEGEDAQERDDDRLVDSAAHPLRAAGGGHALVGADDRDDGSEQGGLHHRSPQVDHRRVRQQRCEEGAERCVERERGQHAAEDAEQKRVDVEQRGDDHQREEARDDQVLDRVDPEHLERVELLADLARAEVGGDRRAGDAGEDDRGHERRELADRGEHEEAAEAVERPEQDEEVAGLEAGRAVPERDRRDQQREPAQPQREEELDDELAAVRVRGPEGGHDRLARQDHHVADLFEQVLRR